MSRILGIVSGKGGTGKSTVSYGLGVALTSLGQNVLLVDLDEGLRCLDIISGIESDVVTDLSDAVSGSNPEASVYPSKFYNGLFIAPAPLECGVLNYVNLSEFTNCVKDRFDTVIFDFPAGIDYDKLAAIGNKAQFTAVCNMDPISLRDAAAIARSLPETVNEPRLIINKYNPDYIKNGIYENIDDMIDKASLRLLGIIPGSIELSMLPLSHKISKKSKAFASLLRTAKRIMGDEVKLPKPSKI